MTEEDTNVTDDMALIPKLEDDDTLGIRFLASAEIKLFRAGDALRITIEGDRSCLRVVPFYAFPHSVRDRYISLRDMDGYELGIIRSLEDLDKDIRKLLEEELRKRYVTPVILEIKSISDGFDIVEWEVETDRGPKTFVTLSLYESLKENADGLIVTDMENNRYEIHDSSELDPASAAILTKRI
jgi:hypothetical protein